MFHGEIYFCRLQSRPSWPFAGCPLTHKNRRRALAVKAGPGQRPGPQRLALTDGGRGRTLSGKGARRFINALYVCPSFVSHDETHFSNPGFKGAVPPYKGRLCYQTTYLLRQRRTRRCPGFCRRVGVVVMTVKSVVGG